MSDESTVDTAFVDTCTKVLSDSFVVKLEMEVSEESCLTSWKNKSSKIPTG